MVSTLDGSGSNPGRDVGIALTIFFHSAALYGYGNAGGSPAMDYHPIPGGVEILFVASRDRNRDKLRPNVPLGFRKQTTITSVAYCTCFLPAFSCRFRVTFSPHVMLSSDRATRASPMGSHLETPSRSRSLIFNRAC